MGKKSSPDYTGAAEATAESNREATTAQTYANRANQYGPEGSLTWTPYQTIDPATGNPVTAWEQNTSLSPELQRLYDQELGIRGNLYDVAGVASDNLMSQYGAPIDWSGLSPYGEVSDAQLTYALDDIGDPNQFRQSAEDAAYEAQMMRINPDFDEQYRAMEVRLRNQGLGPEDAAWQAQMASIGQNYNDATQLARLASSAEGRAEAGQIWDQLMGENQNLFGQLLASNDQNFEQANTQFNQANALRAQEFAELLTQRGFGLNELQAMIQGQQVAMPTFGGYNTAGNAGGVDYAGAARDEGNFDAAGNQAFWSGLGSLAGAGATAYAGRNG